jgi:hypothetical protein
MVTSMDTPTDTALMIGSLSDAQIMRVLGLVLRQVIGMPDPARLGEIEEHLHEAAADPTLTRYLDRSGEPTSEAALARAALIHLATSDSHHADLIRQAADTTDAATRYDPVSIAVGGLVLLSLQTEVELTHTEQGHWRLRIHKQPMRDSTLGQLLARLISLYGHGGK